MDFLPPIPGVPGNPSAHLAASRQTSRIQRAAGWDLTAGADVPATQLNLAARGAARDASRPRFHARPPGNWQNDPFLCSDGAFYHLYYQSNPTYAEWGNIHWGHMRSSDRVFWEHLPPALVPDLDAGEEHCFSGSVVVRPSDGIALAFYTSIDNRDGKGQRQHVDSAVQCRAVSQDGEQIRWSQDRENPVLKHPGGDIRLYEWRDPYVFFHEERSFLLISGTPETGRRRGMRSIIQLYEAEDEDLLEWRFCGNLVDTRELAAFAPRPVNAGLFEVPNLFPVEDKWALTFSPHSRVEYYVGDFFPDLCRFVPEQHGYVDWAENSQIHHPDTEPVGPTVPTFYATSAMTVQGEEPTLVGWIGASSATGNQHWKGCTSLPRRLALDEQGRLYQAPIAALEDLRINTWAVLSSDVQNGREIALREPAVEIELRVDLRSVEKGDRVVLSGKQGAKAAKIFFDPNTNRFHVGAESAQIDMALPESLPIRAFLDGVVLEVFLGGEVVTTVLDFVPENVVFESPAAFSEVRIHQMASIWDDA